MMLANFRFAAVAVVLLLSQVAREEEDAHDKLVYGRYSKSSSRPPTS